MKAVNEPWVDEVLSFWFGDLKPAQWWRADVAIDAEIARRFRPLWERLRVQPPEIADGRTATAAVIVLDQFPRNLFRGRAEAFSTDPPAREIALRAVDTGLDRDLSEPERQFLYMPFQHSEALEDQCRSVELFAALTLPNAAGSAQKHKALIDRFGRFPHRNSTLGRASTPQELEHLKTASGFEKS